MSKDTQSTLKQHMSAKDRKAMEGLPTKHYLMIEKTGKARAGKTARDKAKRGEK
jgi:hypothetical protein